MILLMEPVQVFAAPPQGTIPLLQSLNLSGPTGFITLSGGTGTFQSYFNDAAPFIFDIAISFCIIWVLIGGMMYMTSGNDQGRRSSAISRMTWAILGLLMMLFAGFILKSINSIFYV